VADSGPFIVLFHECGADEVSDGGAVGKRPTTPVRRRSRRCDRFHLRRALFATLCALAQVVGAAALPGGTGQSATDRGDQAGMSLAGDQDDAGQATGARLRKTLAD
jgi:hypothetical protein